MYGLVQFHTEYYDIHMVQCKTKRFLLGKQIQNNTKHTNVKFCYTWMVWHWQDRYPNTGHCADSKFSLKAKVRLKKKHSQLVHLMKTHWLFCKRQEFIHSSLLNNTLGRFFRKRPHTELNIKIHIVTDYKYK